MPPELRSESKNRASGHANAGLENSLASFSLNTTKQEGLRKEIDAAWKTIPRFLFRVWTEKSGGDARLNTTQAITPAAFLDAAHAPEKFEEMPIKKLKNLAELHVRQEHGSGFKTTFSSWSQSLGFVLSWAISFYRPSTTAMATRHISILDTSLISKENVILSFPTMRKHLGAKLPNWSVEFLIYGVVEGPGYCAVPFRNWAKAGLQAFIPSRGLTGFGYPDPFVPGEAVMSDISENKIEVAKRIANLFPCDFQLAIALYLLSVGIDVRRQKAQVLFALMERAVPRHWKKDKKVTLAPNMELNGSPDAVGAAGLLQHLALYGLPRPGREGRSDSVAAEADDSRRALKDDVAPQKISASPTAADIEHVVGVQGRAAEAEDIARMYGTIVGLFEFLHEIRGGSLAAVV